MIGPDFAQGWLSYEDHHPGDDEKRIVLSIHLGPGGEQSVSVIVDTGAPWNILDPEITREAGIHADPLQPERILIIRGRRVRGRLGRGMVLLKAERGESLEVEGVFFRPRLDADEPWPFPNFLGYGGLLEWIRFAVDPSVNRFWFGQP